MKDLLQGYPDSLRYENADTLDSWATTISVLLYKIGKDVSDTNLKRVWKKEGLNRCEFNSLRSFSRFKDTIRRIESKKMYS